MRELLFWTAFGGIGVLCGIAVAIELYARRHGPADRYPWLHPDRVTQIEDRAQRQGVPPWQTR